MPRMAIIILYIDCGGVDFDDDAAFDIIGFVDLFEMWIKKLIYFCLFSNNKMCDF